MCRRLVTFRYIFPVHVLGIEFKSKPLSILILLGSDRWWHCQELNYLSIYVVIHHNHLHRITIQLANSGYNFNSICLPHPSLERVSTLSYDLRYVPIPLIQLGVLKATYNNRRPSNTPYLSMEPYLTCSALLPSSNCK